jgi:hypothetical protein
MSAQIKMITTVLVLCLIGGGIAFHKSRNLGVPFLENQRVDEWMVEARLSFFATGKNIEASLALPTSAIQQRAGQESGSLGYSYHVKPELDEHTAIWSGTKREGNQALYYRVRFRVGAKNSSEPIPAIGVPEKPEIPSLPGSAGKAAQDLVDRAREITQNHDALFVMLFNQINDTNSVQEYTLVKRHYEKDKISNLDIMIGIDLLGMAGVPARLAYGVRLDEEMGAQKPIPLVEYFDGSAWVVRDPLEPSKVLDWRKYFVWHRGGGPLYDVSGGENSRLTLTAVRTRIPLSKLTDISDSPFLISTVLALPASEQAIFRYIVLIPLGAFVVVLMRNLIGISTLGTFMPVLLALALLEIKPVVGILMFSTLVGAGLWFRFLLSRMNLLVVPRVAACVVIVTLLMILMSVISHKMGYSVGIQITLFPMIIIAWTLERMSLIWEEEGKRSAIVQVSGSVIVAVCAYKFMSISQMQYWAFYFPELLLILLAGIILIGRYTGYRLSELIRFKTFTNA